MDKLKNIIDDIINALKKLIPAGSALKKHGQPPAAPHELHPGIPMKFPYTFSAKVAQFPYRYYINNNWMYKYYIAGIIFSLPVILKCHLLANSSSNKKKWAEIKRKEALELEERFH